MGKKQHQKDKLYLTRTEWSTLYGGKRAAEGQQQLPFKRLPFDCCSITFTPVKHPYCTKEGVVFDLENIVPFVKKFGINPVTGEKMSPKDLIKLNMFKNAAGLYHCPITYKVFNETTHIVAIAKTGNVYAFEAVDRLNLKANCLRDLITNEPFARSDILTIQDPSEVERYNISNFYHVLHRINVNDKSNKGFSIRAVNQETKDVLSELASTHKPIGFSTEVKSSTHKVQLKDEFNAAPYSTGKAAASLTSTVMEPTTVLEAATLDDDVVRYARVKSKAYLRMVTNFGHINLELHCDMVPKTCENFLILCRRGYYDETKFHRLIRYFVLQGGDPTGTGQGGDSAWGGAFKDEFNVKLTHDNRGILSMANSGKDTNRSQFFITLRATKHLNNKHTVFGKVVGGMETLDKIEQVETDKNDKPIEDVIIHSCTIFVDPFEEADRKLAEEREAKRKAQSAAEEKADEMRPRNRAEELALELAKASKNAPATVPRGGEKKQGVGMFLNLKRKSNSKVSREASDSLGIPSETLAKKKQKLETLASSGDFSQWD